MLEISGKRFSLLFDRRTRRFQLAAGRFQFVVLATQFLFQAFAVQLPLRLLLGQAALNVFEFPLEPLDGLLQPFDLAVIGNVRTGGRLSDLAFQLIDARL